MSSAGDLTEAAEVVDLAIKAATAYRRPDLTGRLRVVQRRLANREVIVLVTGDYKQGKTSLINAVLGVDVLPVDDGLATAVPVFVRHAQDFEAVAVVAGEDGDGSERRPVAVEGLRKWVLEDAGQAVSVRGVELGVPSPLLADGLVLIDAPGEGGLRGSAAALAASVGPLADGVAFVTDASAELSATEVAFLRRLAKLATRVVVVESKIDLHAQWRQVAEVDRAHLKAAGLHIPVVSISAHLRRLAMESEDDVLDDESGVPVLLDWWLGEPSDVAGSRTVAEAGRVMLEVAARLRHQFEAERAALLDPAAHHELAQRVERARAAANEAGAVAGRWMQVFNDAFADFSSDVDHDLRERIRELCSRSDAAIDDLDPASAWSEFERWLRAEVADAVSAHCAWRHERLVTCVSRVQQVLGAEAGGAVAPDVDAAALVGNWADATVSLGASASGPAAQALTLVRASVGGVVVFSVIGGLAGLVVAPPVMVGLGLALGTKGLQDERKRQLAQRRAQAKVAARRYVDDVLFAVGKGSRDALRTVQREFREQFGGRAEEVLQGARGALASATEALSATDGQRKKRLTDIDAELRRIEGLAGRAARLMPGGA